MARAFPNLPPDEITRLAQQATGGAAGSSSKSKPASKPTSTTRGPKRTQTLVLYNSTSGWNIPQPNVTVARFNNALHGRGSDLRVLSMAPYLTRGFALQHNRVPRPSEIDVLRGLVYDIIPGAKDQKPQVTLPMARSFLKVIDVPRLRPVAYAKNGSSTEQTGGEDIESALKNAPATQHLHLVGAPRIVRDSSHSTTCHAFFEVWDSQSGTAAKGVDNKFVFVMGHPPLPSPVD